MYKTRIIVKENCQIKTDYCIIPFSVSLARILLMMWPHDPAPDLCWSQHHFHAGHSTGQPGGCTPCFIQSLGLSRYHIWAAKNNSFLVRTVLCPIQFAGVFGQVELHGQLSVLGLKHLADSWGAQGPDSLPGAAQISWTLIYVEFLVSQQIKCFKLIISIAVTGFGIDTVKSCTNV